MSKEALRNPNNLPTKTCAACGRPFTWRKKWAKDWENVRYCSDRCRSQGNIAERKSAESA